MKWSLGVLGSSNEIKPYGLGPTSVMLSLRDLDLISMEVTPKDLSLLLTR